MRTQIASRVTFDPGGFLRNKLSKLYLILLFATLALIHSHALWLF